MDFVRRLFGCQKEHGRSETSHETHQVSSQDQGNEAKSKTHHPQAKPGAPPGGTVAKTNAHVGEPTHPERQGAALIQVDDPWGEHGTGPFILEQNPDIEAVLSSPKPNPPKPEAQWNAYRVISGDETRSYLAMAYLRHPDPEVRKATIRFVGSRPRAKLRVGCVLAQRLAVDVLDIRSMAAKAIWMRGAEELREAMNYLAGNDESPGDDGNGSRVSREDVRTALQVLRDANPADEKDFIGALLRAWCWHDDRIAAQAGLLVQLWFEKGTFLDGESMNAAREVGTTLHSIGGFDVMKVVLRPLTLLAGSTAERELELAFDGIGGWIA